MRSKIINQPNRLNGVMGLNPVNDGKKCGWIVRENSQGKYRRWIHPGHKDYEMLKGLIGIR